MQREHPVLLRLPKCRAQCITQCCSQASALEYMAVLLHGAHLVAALGEEGLLDAALEGVIGGHVKDLEVAAVVQIPLAHQQVVDVGCGLYAGQPHKPFAVHSCSTGCAFKAPDCTSPPVILLYK